MNGEMETLVIMGGFVLLAWLHAIFFDRIQNVSALWARWLPVTETAVRLRPVLRVAAKAFAVFASLVFALMLLGYAVG